jgi:hypothetical protein
MVTSPDSSTSERRNERKEQEGCCVWVRVRGCVRACVCVSVSACTVSYFPMRSLTMTVNFKTLPESHSSHMRPVGCYLNGAEVAPPVDRCRLAPAPAPGPGFR